MSHISPFKVHMVNCVSSVSLVSVCVMTRAHHCGGTKVFCFLSFATNGNCLETVFFFRLHFFFVCECVFCFVPLQDTMADAKGTDSRTKELLEPATLFVQYRVRNVVKKSLQLPAPFLTLPSSCSVPFMMFLQFTQQFTNEGGYATKLPEKCSHQSSHTRQHWRKWSLFVARTKPNNEQQTK